MERKSELSIRRECDEEEDGIREANVMCWVQGRDVDFGEGKVVVIVTSLNWHNWLGTETEANGGRFGCVQKLA